jgi:hypothetical protein
MCFDPTIRGPKASREISELIETDTNGNARRIADSGPEREHIDLEYLGRQEAEYLLGITEDVLGYTKILQELTIEKGLTREVFASLHRNKKDKNAFTTVSAFTKAFEAIHESLAERISETFSDTDGAGLRRCFPTLWSWVSDSRMKDLMKSSQHDWRNSSTHQTWVRPPFFKHSRGVDPTRTRFFDSGAYFDFVQQCLPPLLTELEDLIANLHQDVDSFPLKDYSKPVDGVSVVEQNVVKASLVEELISECDAGTLELNVAEQILRNELDDIDARKVARQREVDELEQKRVAKSLEVDLANQKKLDYAAKVFRDRAAKSSNSHSGDISSSDEVEKLWEDVNSGNDALEWDPQPFEYEDAEPKDKATQTTPMTRYVDAATQTRTLSVVRALRTSFTRVEDGRTRVWRAVFTGGRNHWVQEPLGGPLNGATIASWDRIPAVSDPDQSPARLLYAHLQRQPKQSRWYSPHTGYR